MVTAKKTCVGCGQEFVVVLSAPKPGTVADWFAGIEMAALPGPAIGPDEPCPTCGTAVEGEKPDPTVPF